MGGDWMENRKYKTAGGISAGKIIIRLVFFLIFLTMALSVSTPAFAKEYHFSEIKIVVYVSADGYFDLVENRTYDFSGDFHWADYTLLTKGATG